MTYTLVKAGVAPSTRTLLRRDADGAFIPADPANTDWQAYQAWLKAGKAPAEIDDTRAQRTDRKGGSPFETAG